MRLLFTLFCFCTMAHSQENLFIVQGLDESLAAIDISDGNVNEQAVALGAIPNDIIYHNGFLYVTSSGLNTVQEINPQTLTTVREISVTGGVNVWSAAFLNLDTMAVTCSISNNVKIIRASDEQIVATLPGGVWPQGAIVSGNRLFVTSTGVNFPNFEPGSVLVYDCTTLQRLDSLPVGTNPQNAAIDPMNRLHVVCTGNYDDISGSIHIINLETFETDTVLYIGGTPTNVAFSNQFAFVAAGGWVAGGEVYKYDLNSLQVINSSSNPIATGFGAYDIEVDTNGDFYVSCFDLDAVEHYTANGSLIEGFPVSNGPGQMVLTGSGSALPQPPRAVPLTVELMQAFPNPFNGSVAIELSRASSRTRKIYIYDMLGRLVDQLDVSPNANSVSWVPSSNASSQVSTGLYIARAESGTGMISKRLIYMR